ncbi:MAG TPA: SDR family oxidoreductase [Myxococcales bacterium LLY-WYZ-16_1]|nr:SDR family oxidoreductase [Myxococcales bacterium LLY-WYZ-16_1]
MILVMGASGTVGSLVVRRLVGTGRPVRAAYRTRPVQAPGIEAVPVDLATGEGLDPALAGVDDMFLLTADGPDQETLQLTAVERALEAGVSRIVLLSVMGAETEAFAYARTHRAAERRLEASGRRFVILRPNAFMQNFLTHYRAEIEATGAFALPCGEAAVSHVDARDVADVAAHVLRWDEHDGRVYELTGPQALTFAEVAAIVRSAAGIPVRYRPVDDDTFREASLGFGVPEDVVDRVLEQHRFTRGDSSARITSGVAQVLGRAPRTFADFVRECWT